MKPQGESEDIFKFDPSKLWADGKTYGRVNFTQVHFSADGKEQGTVMMPSGEARQTYKNESEMIAGAKEFERLCRLAEQIITPEQIQGFIDVLRSEQEKKESVLDGMLLPAAYSVTHHLLTVYTHMDGAKDDLTEDDFEAVAMRVLQHFKEASDNPEIWEMFARYYCINFIAYGLQEMYAEIGAGKVARMSERRFRQLLDKYLFGNKAAAVSREMTNLLFYFAQDLSRMFVDAMDVPNLTRAQLEKFLGIAGDPVSTPARPQDIDPLPRFMELANSAVYYRTREIIAHGDFARNGGERWPTGYIRCGDLSADVQIKPDPATVEPYLAEEDLIGWQEKAADIALEMDDETADVLDYITYEVVNQANNPEQDVTFSAYRFSQLRGIQKQKAGDGHRGGYKTEYRRDFAREVEKLGTTWIRVAEMEVIEPDEKGKRRRSKKRGLESRAIVVSARAGQMNLGGRIEPDSYRGRLGPLFAASVFGVWRQTALVSIKALGYDPYRQLPEKRLTRYLSWQWRIRQGFGNYLQPYEVSTLLEAAGMSVDRAHPERTKNRLEKALETLTTDGIVSGWQYGEGWNEDIVGKRGWAAQWKDWRIVVEPPQEILDRYKTIPVMEQKTPKALSASGETIGARLQAALTDLGHTQLQAAEDIGINQATLSRVIRGKNPAPAILKKIVTWLDNLHSQKSDNQA
ncbi:MAG: helix-turn-helix protein [Candidatus Hydrogenedentes bacterium ADurb.Bin101]|nr:MAG: helix-turn-helix protein [Candidatus Hydrogenedentes bacterium ADurb.Bin101]